MILQILPMTPIYIIVEDKRQMLCIIKILFNFENRLDVKTHLFMLMKIDKYWIGIIVGLLLPLLFIYVYLARYNLLSSFLTLGSALSFSVSRLLLLSVFPNMAFVFVFYSLNAWKFSQGLLYGMFPYLIACAIMSV